MKEVAVVTIACLLFIRSVFSDSATRKPCTGDKINKNHCTCNSSSIIKDLNKIFRVDYRELERNPKQIEEDIRYFRCKTYVAIPPMLTVYVKQTDARAVLAKRHYHYTHRRKRVPRWNAASGGAVVVGPKPQTPSYRNVERRRKRRQTSLGKPTEEVLEKIVATIPKNSSHYYVPLGGKIKIPCSPPVDVVEEDLHGGKRTFVWTLSDGAPITAPQTHLDADTGEFIFEAVTLNDIDHYNCTVTFTEDGSVKTYQSQLDVVTTPMLWIRFGSTYNSDLCPHTELKEIEDKIPGWVRFHACHFCTVRNPGVKCYKKSGSNRKAVQLNFEISTIGVEDYITDWKHSPDACSIQCVEMIHTRVIGIVRDSIIALFGLSIEADSGGSESNVYESVEGAMDADIARGCPGGFYIHEKLCFPCPAGQYSPHGEAECSRCSVGTFQSNLASSACVPCTDDRTTLKAGATSSMACVHKEVDWITQYVLSVWNSEYRLYVLIGGGVAAALLLTCIICTCCVPGSICAKCLKEEPDEGDIADPSREKLVKKRDRNSMDSTDMVREKRSRHSKPKSRRRRDSYDERDYDDRDKYDRRSDYIDSTETVREKRSGHSKPKSRGRRDSYERDSTTTSTFTKTSNNKTVVRKPSLSPEKKSSRTTKKVKQKRDKVKKSSKQRPIPVAPPVAPDIRPSESKLVTTSSRRNSSEVHSRERQEWPTFRDHRPPNRNTLLRPITSAPSPSHRPLKRSNTLLRPITPPPMKDHYKRQRGQQGNFSAPMPSPSFPHENGHSRSMPVQKRGPGFPSDEPAANDPSMVLGNVLNSSRSLQLKLAERRARLDNLTKGEFGRSAKRGRRRM